MQSGGLFQGDIYSNITISSPGLPMADAWEAALELPPPFLPPQPVTIQAQSIADSRSAVVFFMFIFYSLTFFDVP